MGGENSTFFFISYFHFPSFPVGGKCVYVKKKNYFVNLLFTRLSKNIKIYNDSNVVVSVDYNVW